MIPRPAPSNPHQSTEDDILEEHAVAKILVPEEIQEQRHGSVRSPSRITVEEISSIPFHGPEGHLHSTPKGHHGPSSSITTAYSNTQPSTITEDLLESIDNIRLDSSYSSLPSSQVSSSSSRASTAQSKETPSIRKTRFRPYTKPHIDQRKVSLFLVTQTCYLISFATIFQFKATVRERNREALKLRMYHVRKHHRELVDGRTVKGHLKLSSIRDSYSKLGTAAMNFADFQLLLQHLGVDRPHRMRQFDSPPERY